MDARRHVSGPCHLAIAIPLEHKQCDQEWKKCKNHSVPKEIRGAVEAYCYQRFLAVISKLGACFFASTRNSHREEFFPFRLHATFDRCFCVLLPIVFLASSRINCVCGVSHPPTVLVISFRGNFFLLLIQFYLPIETPLSIHLLFSNWIFVIPSRFSMKWFSNLQVKQCGNLPELLKLS